MATAASGRWRAFSGKTQRPKPLLPLARRRHPKRASKAAPAGSDTGQTVQASSGHQGAVIFTPWGQGISRQRGLPSYAMAPPHTAALP